MTRSNVLQLGMMAVAICIVFVVVGSVTMLVDGNPMGAFLCLIILVPILAALYVTFDYVRRQLAGSEASSQIGSKSSDVAGTPWESKPDYTKGSSQH